MDEGFLRRVRAISWVAAVAGGLFGTGYLGWRWGAGFTVAAVWSIWNLLALERLIRLSLRPAGRQTGAIALALVIKLPVLYGLGALIALFGGFPLGSLLIGVAVPLVVMALKAGGQVLAPRVALPHPRGVPARGDGAGKGGPSGDTPHEENPNGR